MTVRWMQQQKCDLTGEKKHNILAAWCQKLVSTVWIVFLYHAKRLELERGVKNVCRELV